MVNKLRNYWTKQSQTDFFVAEICRTFNMFIQSPKSITMCLTYMAKEHLL